jgi:hypothetical protein
LIKNLERKTDSKKPKNVKIMIPKESLIEKTLASGTADA